jgi:hypothetical protein
MIQLEWGEMVAIFCQIWQGLGKKFNNIVFPRSVIPTGEELIK